MYRFRLIIFLLNNKNDNNQSTIKPIDTHRYQITLQKASS